MKAIWRNQAAILLDCHGWQNYWEISVRISRAAWEMVESAMKQYKSWKDGDEDEVIVQRDYPHRQVW